MTDKQRFTIHKTPFVTLRVFVERDAGDEADLIEEMGKLSIWGGSDKLSTVFRSWEIPQGNRLKAIALLSNFGLQCVESKKWTWIKELKKESKVK